MTTPLRVLLLEDSPTDAEVMLLRLREAGYAPDWRRVEGEAEYLAHLEPSLDLILVDYTLPEFDGRRALQLLGERGLDIPAIVVTGTVSEETALECVRLGAADYLLKDRLTRLGEAVRSAIAQRTLRRERMAAEAARQASEDRARFLADVLEHSSQPFCVGFPDGRLGIVNSAFCTLLGYGEEELRATDWARDLTPPEWRGFEANYLAELQRTGRPVRYEKEFLRKDGSSVPVELLVHLVRGSGTHPLYYYAFVTDLTQRLRAEQDLAARTRQLEAVRMVSTEITRELDLERLLQLISQRAAELVGDGVVAVFLWDEKAQVLAQKAWSSPEDPALRRLPVRLGEDLAGRVAQRRKGMLVNEYRSWPSARPVVLERTNVTAGLAEPLLYRDRLVGVIVLDNRDTGRWFTEQDAEVLRLFAPHAAIAIENANLYAAVRSGAATLAARVQERTHQLEEARRRADAASQAKSEFLMNMSHELRTPLNSVLGFAQLLLDRTQAVLPEKDRRYLTHIHASGQHLLRLINDVLDLSTIDAGKLDLQATFVSVPHAVQEVLAMVRGAALAKGLTLQAAVPPDLPRLTADPYRFKQILLNLLSNALKFTPKAGRVSLTACQVSPDPADLRAGGGDPAEDSRRARPWLELRVDDTGIGIKATDLPRLFEKFVQLEAAPTKRYEGTGLGLALTKRLVELHGGRIWAASPGEGQGSTFTLRLPLAEPAEPSGRSAVSPSASAACP